MADDKRARFGFNIFHKLLLTMLIVAMIPLSGLWYINYYKAIDDWTTVTGRQLSRTVVALTKEVDAWSDMNIRALRQNAALGDIVSMVAQRQNPILKSMAQAYEWSYLLFTIAADGRNIGRSDDQAVRDYGDRVYFLDVMAGRPVGQQVLIGRTSGKPSMVMSVPILEENQQRIGVLAMAMTLEAISRIIVEEKLGKTGFAFLLDQSGKVIAHQNPEFHNTLQDFSDHPAFTGAQGMGTQQLSYQDKGEQVIAYAHRTGLGWTVVVQQDYDEAFAPVREAQRDAFVLLFITVVLVGTIAYVLSERLATPILRLAAVADDMSRGKLDVKLKETERSDEIGALARAIERMGVSIQMALERLRKKA